jgi:hypothetical protein
MLAHLQRQSANRKEIRGWRKTEVDVNASSHLGVEHSVDSPTSSAGGSDPDVDRLLSEIANDRGGLGSERYVRHHIVLNVTVTRSFSKHCRSRETPSIGQPD